MFDRLRKRYHGILIETSPDMDRTVSEVPTVMCCHCQAHFPAPRFGTAPGEKESRMGRGWCGNCAGYICSEECNRACVPWELMLENWEKGRPLDFKPIIVTGG